MAIIGHRAKQGENTGNVSLEGREYTAELFVESNDPEDTGHSVIQYLIAQGYRYGAAYNVGNDNLSSRTPLNIYLYQIEPPTLAPGSSTLWTVLLRYRQLTPGDSEQGNDNKVPSTPYRRRPAISTSTVTRSKAIHQAIYRSGLTQQQLLVDKSYVICNSALDPIYPPVEIEYQNRVLRVVRNFAAVNINNVNMPLKWINSVGFVLSDRQTTISIAQHTLKLLNWSTEPAFEDGYDYVRITFEGEINEDGWRLRILDQGFNELGPMFSASIPREKRPIRIEGEGRPALPVLLDGNGQVLEIPPNTINDAKFGIWSALDEIDPRTLAFFIGITS